jgi:hypothetical protein
MQVDTGQLRRAAAHLRAEVIKPLQRALDLTPGSYTGAFDSYPTDRPFGDAASAWEAELETMRLAAWELADKLEATADDYDKADTHAVQRLTATR